VKKFIQRRVAHAKENAWWYAGFGIMASVVMTWGTNEMCVWSKAKVSCLHQHYLQSETNTMRIEQLELDLSNLTARVSRHWATNKLDRTRIDNLEETNENLKYWVRKLQKP
jgi:hypothetical protein